MKSTIRKFAILALMLVGLPLVGVALRGTDVRQYLEFPPLTRYVKHAEFSWPAFVLVLLAALAFFLPLAWAILYGRRRSAGAPATSSARFPWWGWLGLLLGAVSWGFAWTRFGWFATLQRHTFTPLWISYILVVNALCYRRSSRCPLTHWPGRYLLLFPCSAVFWWFFEYLNRFVQNWYYLGVAEFSAAEYIVLASISFSTVLPAVIGTCELLKTFPALNEGLADGRSLNIRVPKLTAALTLVVAGLGLALIGVLPGILFPLLWISPLLIVTALQTLAGKPNIFTPVRQGDWRNLVVPALAALICGWFWEMWNFLSLAKWEYTIPFVDRFDVFEMPALGYTGYLPFGLECVVISELIFALRLERGRAPGVGQVSLKRLLLRQGIGLLIFILAIRFIPVYWCGRTADALYDGEPARQQALAAGVESWTSGTLALDDFHTGSDQFNGEWLFGTYMMAAMGFGQTALEHPEWRERQLRNMERCFERLLSPEVQAFDRGCWATDALESLDSSSEHHAAYLGYFNLALSLYRELLNFGAPRAAVAPGTLGAPASQTPPQTDTEPFTEAAGPADFERLNDRITASLVRWLDVSPLLLLETYPREVYPVDNCAVISSIALYDRATGADHSELIRRWTLRCRRDYMDPETGLLYQAVHPETGAPIDAPRGSGTTLGLFFLAYGDRQLSADLFDAVKRHLAGGILGFGLVREYPKSDPGGGDIDSGPIILGYGVSPTGFFLAGCRMHGERDYYRQIYATAYLTGAPITRRGKCNWITGGPIGDAILFAMFTAPRAVELKVLTGQ